MKEKGLILGLIISSLFGYLEWGASEHSFLFDVETNIFKLLFTDPKSLLHPFVLVPLFGQIVLFITLFQHKPRKILLIVGVLCLGILLGFMLVIGLVSGKILIFLSTLPFWVLTVLTWRYKTN